MCPPGRVPIHSHSVVSHEGTLLALPSSASTSPHAVYIYQWWRDTSPVAAGEWVCRSLRPGDGNQLQKSRKGRKRSAFSCSEREQRQSKRGEKAPHSSRNQPVSAALEHAVFGLPAVCKTKTRGSGTMGRAKRGYYIFFALRAKKHEKRRSPQQRLLGGVLAAGLVVLCLFEIVLDFNAIFRMLFPYILIIPSGLWLP